MNCLPEAVSSQDQHREEQPIHHSGQSTGLCYSFALLVAVFIPIYLFQFMHSHTDVVSLINLIPCILAVCVCACVLRCAHEVEGSFQKLVLPFRLVILTPAQDGLLAPFALICTISLLLGRHWGFLMRSFWWCVLFYLFLFFTYNSNGHRVLSWKTFFFPQHRCHILSPGSHCYYEAVNFSSFVGDMFHF